MSFESSAGGWIQSTASGVSYIEIIGRDAFADDVAMKRFTVHFDAETQEDLDVLTGATLSGTAHEVGDSNNHLFHIEQRTPLKDEGEDWSVAYRFASSGVSGTLNLLEKL